MFVGIWVGLFVVLPICVYLGVKRLFSGSTKRYIINTLGICGILGALYMVSLAVLTPTRGPGDLAILILIPLGGLLGLTCAGLLWQNNRR